MFTMEEKHHYGEYAIVIENSGAVSVSVNGSMPRVFNTAALAISWLDRMAARVTMIPNGAYGYDMAIGALEDWLDETPDDIAAVRSTYGMVSA